MADIPVRSFGVSVVALRERHAGYEVLLLRRTRTLKDEWCQIAGGIEEGETAWQAAIRELAEETALISKDLYYADICEQFYEADRDAISIMPVFVAYIDEDAEVIINHEHSEFRWVSFEDAIQMVPFAGQRHVLRHVEHEFANRSPHHLLRIEVDSANSDR